MKPSNGCASMVIKVTLKGIHHVKRKLADGTERDHYYAWRGGPALKGKPGTDEFRESFEAAKATQKEPKKGKLFSLIVTYKQSTEFLRLGDRTRSDYLKQIAKIEAEFGTLPLSAMEIRRTRGAFKAWRDKLALKSVRQADYAWVVLARILSVAKDRGLIDTNPCEKGGRLYAADRTESIWTEADEAAFYASAPAHLHLALTLALWTGQRQGDLLRLTWGAYDGKYLRLRQGKTRARVTIPVGAPLKAALDASKRRGALILLTKDGERWTPDGFRSSWRKACIAAGVTDVTFHDLRGSAVTRLAVAGCEVPEIASLTGHSLADVNAILDAHYLSRDVRLAESAVRKLEAGTGTKPVNGGVNGP
jgi:integrase